MEIKCQFEYSDLGKRETQLPITTAEGQPQTPHHAFTVHVNPKT